MPEFALLRVVAEEAKLGEVRACNCGVGKHRSRARIEQRIASGETLYAIGSAYGFSRETVRRHWRKHLTQRERDGLIRRVNALKPIEEIDRAMADAVCEPLELCSKKLAELETAYQTQREGGNWVMALLIDKRQLDWSIYQSKLTGPLRRRDHVTLIQQNFGDDRREFERRALQVVGREPNILLRDFLDRMYRPEPPLLDHAGG